jgi:hypothetical protein
MKQLNLIINKHINIHGLLISDNCIQIVII